MRRIAAGNWKMNGSLADLAEVEALVSRHPALGCEVLICPPATLIASMARRFAGRALAIGAQDCHADTCGAHTGDIAAGMLADAGATHVILGHSERRTDHGEDDALIARKIRAARAAGLVAILCVGESAHERDGGRTTAVVGAQLAGSLPPGTHPGNTIIAYEPVWAIGSGRIPEAAEIAGVHDFLRRSLVQQLGQPGADIRLLYGGSVNPGNAAAIFAIRGVDGALVGGASLKARDFGAIVGALDAAGPATDNP